MSSSPSTTLEQDLQVLVGQPVVLDTADSLIYLGTLSGVTPAGFWLVNADLHDCRDGHATKEEYAFEARTSGIRTNRRRVFVMGRAVVSLSALQDVVHEDLAEDQRS